jgi:hypothetical protein
MATSKQELPAASMIENLVRSFEQNQDALMSVVDVPDFDVVEFNQLIRRRDHIVEEILTSNLSEDQLRSMYQQHQRLESHFRNTRHELDAQLKQMDAGKKALKAYR